MNSSSHDDADLLRKRADNKLKGFNIFRSRQTRSEEAAELYARAAAKYRVAKQWEHAAETHMLSAHNYKASSPLNWIDARKQYEEAGRAFSKYSPQDAIPAWRIAAEISLNENSFSIAARLYKSIGELIEEEQLDFSDGIDAYKRAADCFESEDSLRNQCDMLVKVAYLSAKHELLNDAIEVYDDVASSCHKQPSNALGETCVFHAITCRLACASISAEAAEAKLESYKNVYTNLDSSSSSFILLTQLFDAIRESDIDMWNNAVNEFCKNEVMSEFTSSLLSQAKQNKLQQDLLNDDDDDDDGLNLQ